MAKSIKSGKKPQINGGFMICWETCGNGAGIYMMKSIMVHIALLEVVVGRKKSKNVARHVGGEVIHHSK
jgi:hypothetical protein